MEIKPKERGKINQRYRGYYIDYRLFEHEGQHGFATVGVAFSYNHAGNIPINGKYIYNEKEDKVTFKYWIEKHKRMIKTKEYDLPVKYDELEVNQRRAVRLQYMKEQTMQCAHCDMDLREKPANYVESAFIDWDLFPKNFRKHPVHLHHDHKSGMTIGAVHMRCNAWLWQYKGE